MSSFLIVSIRNENLEDCRYALAVRDISKKLNVGTFFENRYVEAFEDSLTYCYHAFSIADNFEYDNCEMLLRPWWYLNYTMEKYENNMMKIKTILEYCLRYTPVLDLWMGTSGESLDDFDYSSISINNFLDYIKRKYQQYSNFSPPSIHVTISRC